jgi:glycosyltransferase involved in cell wall biosynthesis
MSMHVTYFHRKVIPNFHFSVEIIFNDVRRHLPKGVTWDIVTSRFYSKGLFPRLYNGVEAFLRRGKINHVTGDINYIAPFLPARRTIHTILDTVYMQDSKGLKRYIYNLFWIRIPVRRSRFVTTISEASKAEIVQFSGCDPDKVKVIPIALNPVFKKADREYQWEKPRVLMVGAAPNKNIPNILQALRGINCRVQIVGKHNPAYEQFMRDNGMDYTYEWGLNIEQMYAKYRQTDLLIFASTYEGFGMPIIEAQASGVPVVTSSISSMPEVGGKEGAVYVDPYSVESIREGILRVIGDPELRARLIAQGYRNIERFDPTAIANMYVNLYNQI